MVTTVLIFYFHSHEDAEVIYRDSSKLLLNEKGYVWLVPEQALTKQDKTPLALMGKKCYDIFSISLKLIKAYTDLYRVYKKKLNKSEIALKFAKRLRF